MSAFLTALRSGRVLLMDGAMGTELQRAGLQDQECAEEWNLSQPETVRGVHQSYVEAGAEVLLTNTFQANRGALAKHQLAERWSEINREATLLARSAAGPERWVLGDLGPDVAQEIVAQPTLSHEQFMQPFDGVDGVLLETASNRDDLISMLFLRLAADRVPFLFSPTYGRDCAGYLTTCLGRYSDNQPPEFYAERAQEWHIDALGVNCGRDIGMDEILEIVQRYRRATDIPIFVRPNAGTPTRANDRWVYPLTPNELALRVPEMLEAGVSMIGGCCGTTPEHIAALRPVVDEWNARHIMTA